MTTPTEFESGNWRDLSASLQEGELLAVPVPPLIWVLGHFRKEKGSDLTEEEVLGFRDSAVCMVMRRDAAEQMAAARGYADIDPQHAWAEWQAFLRDEGMGENG